MMAFAIQRGSLSFSLLDTAKTCVLAIPGEHLADAAMFCGTKSGSDVNKVEACGLQLIDSATIDVPGLAMAIANVECKIINVIPTGDHRTVVVEVLRFAVNVDSKQRPLVSVGSNTDGYTVLIRKGIHRIAVAGTGL
jgi:flavin reductase (DIM6/NTAB) family NADH-FMN oxidoreductase RutF